jgi:hypothetical protein
MTGRVFVRMRNGSISNLDADRMFFDDIGAGMMLFVYAGEVLRGVFVMSEVEDAHMTGRRE